MSVHEAYLMTLSKNLYGYTPRIEELQQLAAFSNNTPLYDNHRAFEKPIGHIHNAKLIYATELKTLAVLAQIEIFDDERSQKAFQEKIKSGGFSPSYSDGSFIVDESDGVTQPPLRFYFDAYKTDEIELYLEAQKISKEFNIAIECLRFRRHFFDSMLTYVGLSIGAYFIRKIMDDTKLYEKMKSFITNIVGKNKKKEFNLQIIAPEEVQSDIKRLEYTLLGEDEEIKSELDYLKEKNIIELELSKFSSEYSNVNKICFTVENKDEIIVTKKEVKKIKKT